MQPADSEPVLAVPGVTFPPSPVTAPPEPPPPPPPPDPVGRPAPPTMLMVVVLAVLTHVSCVAAPTVNANHDCGGINCCEVEDDAPSAQ